MQFATPAKPENRPKFKDRTKNPPKVMFKKGILILTAVASLTIANVYAIDATFRDFWGHTITQINQTLTILSADQNSIRATWQDAYNAKAVSEAGGIHREAAFYLTNKTSFSGGSRSDAVKGRKIHIAYHFEGDRAVADTITFVK
jgi:hypothetical protein